MSSTPSVHPLMTPPSEKDAGSEREQELGG
jgi:hypothetical protein